MADCATLHLHTYVRVNLGNLCMSMGIFDFYLLIIYYKHPSALLVAVNAALMSPYQALPFRLTILIHEGKDVGSENLKSLKFWPLNRLR